MAAIVRNWKRIVALGCTHGNLMDPKLRRQVLQFVKKYKPDTRVHLGDTVDTTALRSGAAGTRDEQIPLEPDLEAGLEFLDEYVPTHITWGNHDWRAWKESANPKAIFAAAAKNVKDSLIAKAKELHARTYNYHYRDNIAKIGGVHYMHGISFAQNALQKHANYVKGRAVFAHTHRNGVLATEGLIDSSSINVGTLADIKKMTYAHHNMSTGAWAPGIVFGEYTLNESHLWLVTGKQGGELIFPPGVM